VSRICWANVCAPTGVPMVAFLLPTTPVGVVVAHNNPVGAAALASDYRTQ